MVHKTNSYFSKRRPIEKGKRPARLFVQLFRKEHLGLPYLSKGSLLCSFCCFLVKVGPDFFFLRNKLVEKRANLFCGSASLKISKYQGTKVHSKTQKGG